ncbi:hypothetical protein MF271_16025 [Deinococcus sp. KNUC1210]|uniref:hypothetical protein n=1 Tax=Deinococcus sp. KNUC1210 TaxID=2917691 RepID=UPI001EEF9052|nr:hypothetical protein [Deinococcus sp. KNUC1210]ULH15410.1 hypothetical protein MF271_16025 [Deinococcus sp. KNUC1210]
MSIGDVGGEALTLLSELTPAQLRALLDAARLEASGAELRVEHGQDAGGRPRTRLLILHPDPDVVGQARDALLKAGKALGLRLFLV